MEGAAVQHKSALVEELEDRLLEAREQRARSFTERSAADEEEEEEPAAAAVSAAMGVLGRGGSSVGTSCSTCHACNMRHGFLCDLDVCSSPARPNSVMACYLEHISVTSSSAHMPVPWPSPWRIHLGIKYQDN